MNRAINNLFFFYLKTKTNKMVTCGIDIDKTKAIFYFLKEDSNGQIINITGNFKYLVLENDLISNSIKNFSNVIYSHFDSINPNKIAIIQRPSKGQLTASPFSFKIESVIQLYKNVNVEFFHPATIKAFYRRQILPLESQHKYQKPALELAYQLLKN